MVIGMILDSSFPPDPRVENEAVALIGAGHEVHLFCVGYGSGARTRETIQGIQVYRYMLPKHLYGFSALAYTVSYYHRRLKVELIHFIEASGVEVLHVHDIRSARAVFWANQAFRLPVVLDLHENRPEIMRFYAHVNSFSGKLLISPRKWQRYEHKYIQQADRVIVITEEAREHYVKEAGVASSKFCVVPNTVREDFYQNFETRQEIIERYRDHFTLLYIGDTGARRGLATAVHAIERLVPQIPNIKLVVVGSSKEDALLEDQVKTLALTDHVDLVGWQDVGLLPSYIQASDVGICPIHRNVHHDTTYANKVFQSMAFGKPVLVSDCLAQKHLVETYECGLVFQDRDVADLTAQTIRLWKEEDLYRVYSANARHAIDKHLKWSVFAQDLTRLYVEGIETRS